jgi:hypothetical protein
MNFSPNNREPFQQNGNSNHLHFPQVELDDDGEEIQDFQPQEYDPQTVKTIQRSFIFLTAIGLIIGVFVAAGVLYLMQRFNITANPAQLEQQIRQ